MTKPAVLVTGGAGYIGSHAVLALKDAGWRVAVVDDLSNGSAANPATAMEPAISQNATGWSTRLTPSPCK